MTSRNMIFEEGTGHCPLTVLGEGEDDPVLSTPRNVPTPTAPSILPARQPVAPRIRLDSGPVHATVPDTAPGRAQVLTPAEPHHTTESQLPLHRLSRMTQPTPALIVARETLQRERDAREDGADWAAGGDTPTALAAESPFGYLSVLTQDNDDITKTPKTYAEAMKQPHLWKPAMDEELKTMEDRGVFELVDEKEVPKDKNVVGCRWVYVNKFNADGNVVWRKAWLVAKGYSQVAGEDFDETYAAVVCLELLRMSAAIATQESFKIWQVNFVSAYLNSIPEHEVYMRLPPGFPGGEGKLAKLRKTIYGLMQGGFDWYWTLDGAYADLDYTRSHADPCIQSRQVGSETTITNTFNDDTFGLSMTKAGVTLAKRELAQAYEVKDLGDPSFILGNGHPP